MCRLCLIFALAAALPAHAGDELARVTGTWADGTGYTAIVTGDGEEGQARILIYADGGNAPLVDNPHLTGIFDDVNLTAEADGTLVVKTHALIPDQVDFNEMLTIGQWEGEIAVRRYQILFGDPATPDQPPRPYCDANVVQGEIDWADMDDEYDGSRPLPSAADMRLQDWSMIRSVDVEALALCPAYG